MRSKKANQKMANPNGKGGGTFNRRTTRQHASSRLPVQASQRLGPKTPISTIKAPNPLSTPILGVGCRSEEHTSELQSLAYLVCRLLLEKKKKKGKHYIVLNLT